jgi:methyl-accepting chemotaxis protein
MFRKMSLKAKLILSFLFFASLLVVQGVSSFLVEQNISRHFKHVSEVTVEKLWLVSSFSEIKSISFISIQKASLMQDPSEAFAILEKIEEFEAKFNQFDQSYNQTEFDPGEKAIYIKFKEAWSEYLKLTKEAREIFKTVKSASDIEAFKLFVGSKVAQSSETGDQALNELGKYHESSAQQAKEAGLAAVNFGATFNSLVTIFGLLIACIVGYSFSSVLSRKLSQVTQEIEDSNQQSRATGEHMAKATQQLSTGASSAASSLQETVASLEELTSMVKTNSDHAKEANALSQLSKESAERGEKEIAKLIGSMANIASGSKKIEEIISVIDDIAFQTNLLALNAAVEAARAGEQGKGFAVVAEAVRNLAQRSAVAAKDIASLIKENVSKSEDGAQVAESSGTALSEIVLNVKKVSDLNNEIAMASQEQASGIEQISQAMNQLDRLTQETASSAEEINASSESIQIQTQSFNKLIQTLRVMVHGEGSETQTFKLAPKVVKAESNKTEEKAKSLLKSFKSEKKTIEVKTALVAKKTESIESKQEIKQEAKVVPIPKKQKMNDLESILPMESDDPTRKIGGIDGF